MKNFLRPDNFLNFAGIFLIIGFAIRLWADYIEHQNPFYLFIIGRSLIFLLPAIICFIAARYLKKHNNSLSRGR